MLLATTADQRFWETDKRILFLGEWCRLYSQKHIWSQLDHEVLPYHWDDREKLYQDYLLLDQIYESCLSQLTEQLNNLHQTDFPSRYWRIIIGPWLFYIIEIIYDRYLSICAAEMSRKVTNVLLPKSHDTGWAATDFSEFRNWVIWDPFNQYIYSEIIQFSGNLLHKITDLPPSSSPKNIETAFLKPFNIIAQKIMGKLSPLQPDSMNEMVFFNSYIKPIELARLQISLGQLPNPYPPKVKTKHFSTKKMMRDKIKITAGSTTFEALLKKMLPSLLPTTYAEGYQNMHQHALHVFPRNPKLIYTTNGLYGEEGFKFWAAWHVTRGTKLVTSQHGGHYGLAKWSAQEKHEIKVADKNFTWGWKAKDDPRTIPMASGQLRSRIKNLKPHTSGDILWVGVCLPRYSYWMYSIPVGPQFVDYLTDQKRFAEGVLDDVRRLLVYRLNAKDYNWSIKERFSEMFSSVKLYTGPKSFYQQLNESRLCVSSYNSTTYLETFAADFPTLLFWNPNHWEIRPSAQPYFDELREAGILHDTPESAASKANIIYQDPLAWWQSPGIQKIRKRFCDRFARTSPYWMSEWKEELQKLNKD